MSGILMGALRGVGKGMTQNAQLAMEEESKIKMTREMAKIEGEINDSREAAIVARRKTIMDQSGGDAAEMERLGVMNNDAAMTSYGGGLLERASGSAAAADKRAWDEDDRTYTRGQDALKNKREDGKLALDAAKAANEGGGPGGFKPQSTQGKLAADLVAAGVFPDQGAALNALRDDSLIGEAMRAVLQDPTAMIDMDPVMVANKVRETANRLRSTGGAAQPTPPPPPASRPPLTVFMQ